MKGLRLMDLEVRLTKAIRDGDDVAAREIEKRIEVKERRKG